MDRWYGKVAVVTGASSGIGASCVKYLLKNGLIVVGLARRVERIEEIRNDIDDKYKSNLHAKKCDVSQETEVVNAFRWIEENLGGVDILINNAGIYKPGTLLAPDTTENIKRTLDVNVMGIVYCTREAVKSMKIRDVAGHIVLINSIAGHKVIKFDGMPQIYNIYIASKFAVTAMTEVYRMELNDLKTKIKITSISPGVVDTEIIPDEYHKLNLPMLKAEDIADAIIYVLGTPPHVQIHELTIKPVGELQ